MNPCKVESRPTATCACPPATTAGNNVNLSAAQTTRDVDEAHQFKGSSSWLSKKTITTRNTLSETTTQGTTFSGNTTYVQAGNDINVKGSNVVAPQGDITIQAKKVDILEAQETTHSTQETQFKQSGLTVAAYTIGNGRPVEGFLKNSPGGM